MGLWNKKVTLKGAPEYYRLIYKTYNKVKYISFEYSAAFFKFVFIFWEAHEILKRDH